MQWLGIITLFVIALAFFEALLIIADDDCEDYKKQVKKMLKKEKKEKKQRKVE